MKLKVAFARAVALRVGLTCAVLCAVAPAAGAANGAWTGPTNYDQDGNGTAAVSCASTTLCVAVDQNGSASTFNGSVWSPSRAIDPNGGLSSVSCVPGSTFCEAVDNNGHAYSFSSGSWSSQMVSDGSNGAADLRSVSCPSATFCLAVTATTDDSVTFDGTAWSGPTSFIATSINDGPMASVSCPTSSDCWAISWNGYARNFNGSGWGAPQQIDVPGGSEQMSSISCASSASCLAVDTAGHTVMFDGAWHPASLQADANGAAHSHYVSVSCPSDSACVALDGGLGGDALYVDPATGSAMSSPTFGMFLQSVSCASPTFCVAVDSQGNAYLGGGSGTSTSGTPTGAQGCPHWRSAHNGYFAVSVCTTLGSEGLRKYFEVSVKGLISGHVKVFLQHWNGGHVAPPGDDNVANPCILTVPGTLAPIACKLRPNRHGQLVIDAETFDAGWRPKGQIKIRVTYP